MVTDTRLDSSTTRLLHEVLDDDHLLEAQQLPVHIIILPDITVIDEEPYHPNMSVYRLYSSVGPRNEQLRLYKLLYG